MSFVRPQDLVWLLLCAGLAALGPERNTPEVVILSSLAIFQVLESKIRVLSTPRGHILSILVKLGRSLERCIVLCVSEETLVERLRKRAEIEGRSDDNEASIRTRMQVYRRQTAPLIEYYRAQGILAELDGLGSVEQVAQAIDGVLAA